ncbi:MAG: nucleotidyltransferase family protein, partial [Blautia sp.]|nr:nucleotidyltransferase family protein [Blautia sp.]
CGTSEDFLFAAGILSEEPALYREILLAALKNGRSYPEARAHAFRAYLLTQDLSREKTDSLCDLLASPNNILGIEYCKALTRLSSSIRPAPLLRKGDSYHKEDLSVSELPSAKALRQRILNRTNAAIPGSYEHSGKNTPDQTSAQSDTHARRDPDLHFWMSTDAEKLLTENLNAHRCLSESCLDAPLLYALLSAIHRGNLQAYQDMTPELANRIQKTISQYQSFSQYVSLLKTREITQTHIQRALLHVYLGLTKLPENVPYARILGFRKASSELLNRIQKNRVIPFLSKPADAKKILNETAYSVFESDVFCSNLYESLLLSAQPIPNRHFMHELQKQIVML